MVSEISKANGTAAGSQPWITEVFTTKEAVRKEAARQGLPTTRSYSLEFGDDLRLPKKRKEVLQDIRAKKPKLVLMAFPCGPWSNLTYFQKDQAKVQARQERDRPFLRFVKEVAKLVRSYGGAWMI